MAGATAHWLSLVTNAGFELLSIILSSLMWLVLIYVLMSWMKTANDAAYYLAQLVEPLLRPIRRVLPHMGGVDLSPIAVLLLIQIAEIVLHNVQMQVAF
jgi:YggT family protein